MFVFMCVYVFAFFVVVFYHEEISFFSEASLITLSSTTQYFGVKFLNIFF